MRSLVNWYKGNTNTVRAMNLRAASGQALNPGGGDSAQLTEARHEDGTLVTGVVWPLVLVWDAANRWFSADAGAGAVVAIGETLLLKVNASIAGKTYYDELTATVRYPTIP